MVAGEYMNASWFWRTLGLCGLGEIAVRVN